MAQYLIPIYCFFYLIVPFILVGWKNITGAVDNGCYCLCPIFCFIGVFLTKLLYVGHSYIIRLAKYVDLDYHFKFAQFLFVFFQINHFPLIYMLKVYHLFNSDIQCSNRLWHQALSGSSTVLWVIFAVFLPTRSSTVTFYCSGEESEQPPRPFLEFALQTMCLNGLDEI